MNIKSLLLGSAAALVAVSGARAADAIVIAEPEPVEYVRICDAYGAGFFYIPGTETCLRFDGYLQYQMTARGGDEYVEATAASVGIVNGAVGIIPATAESIRDAGEGWRKQTRARMNVDARSDTEWGTLRGFFRLQATTSDNTDADFRMDQAILSLGGFYAGYTESAFAAPWGLPGISRFGILHTDGGGNYAYQQRQQVGYTFSGGNGFFGSIVLEDDALDGEGYMPDIVGVLGVSQGWGGVWAKAAYDESDEEFGGMLGMHYNVPNLTGSSFRVGVFYASGSNDYAVEMPINSDGKAEWSVAASYNHTFNSQWSATIGGQYMEDFAGDSAYLVQAAAVWVPVTNFEVRLEGAYAEEENVVGPLDAEAYSGFLRFRRYF